MAVAAIVLVVVAVAIAILINYAQTGFDENNRTKW